MIRRAGVVATVIFAALVTLPAVASADADLVEAVPAADSTVAELSTITLTFNEPLNADKSSVVVRLDGQSVASGGVDAADAAVMVVTLDAPIAGTYEVRYTANSQDGHLIRDSYSFTYAPAPVATPSAGPSATTAAPSSTVPPTASPDTASPSPDSSPGAGETPATSPIDVLVPIVVVVALIGLLGIVLRRRRA